MYSRRVKGGFSKLSVGKAEEKRGDVAYLAATAIQSFPCQGNINTNLVEALVNSGDLTPYPLNR